MNTSRISVDRSRSLLHSIKDDRGCGGVVEDSSLVKIRIKNVVYVFQVYYC